MSCVSQLFLEWGGNGEWALPGVLRGAGPVLSQPPPVSPGKGLAEVFSQGPEDLQVSAPAKKGDATEGSGLAGSTPWAPGWQHSLRHTEAVGRCECVCGAGRGR